MNYKLTTDVCRQLECSPTALANYLARHPEFKPAKRLQTAFFWTDEEIESVKAARAGALRGPVARPMLDAIDYGDILRKMADEPLEHGDLPFNAGMEYPTICHSRLPHERNKPHERYTHQQIRYSNRG